MKQFLSLLLCVLLTFSFSASVYAVESKTMLSDMSELECLEYIRQCGVTIPDMYGELSDERERLIAALRDWVEEWL